MSTTPGAKKYFYSAKPLKSALSNCIACHINQSFSIENNAFMRHISQVAFNRPMAIRHPHWCNFQRMPVPIGI